MVQFTHLRLSGFKSFVDKTELEISPGLNGIVGPNGCGKSNLVEALRWIMGETSAKRMRGGGMEDVIFNGTDQRTARNIAEVGLRLDNSKREAPAAYNESDEIEVIRRIERDHGSNYKINGKNVRARDVQMLFADTVTGANSPALVSQGQVSKIINSKPLERRLILEESAGISGLYARRHEAELRLKAADSNLTRIEDVLGGMESRLNALKRQARMATKYRNLNAQIRQLEMAIDYLHWQALNARLEETKNAFTEAEKNVTEKMIAVTQLTKTQETLHQDLPELRKAEIELASAIQAQRITLQRIDDAEEQLAQKVRETNEQFNQAQNDRTHEQQSMIESEALIKKLDEEREIIAADQGNQDDILAQKEKIRAELEQKVLKLEDQYTALMQKTTETQVRISGLEHQLTQNRQRVAALNERKSQAELNLKEAIGRDDGNSDAEKEKEIKNFETAVANSTKALEKLDNALAKAEENLKNAQTESQQADTKFAELNTEIQMLEAFFETQNSGNFSFVRDKVKVDTGFEKALSRALGDTLLASTEENAPFRWREIGIKDMPELPEGVTKLADKVKVPRELELALSQIGLVQNEAEGDEHALNLLPGQSLVSTQGTFWRWDGYCISAEAGDRNAVNLEYKNKLAELQKEQPKAEKESQSAKENLVKARETLEQNKKDKNETQIALTKSQNDLGAARLEIAKSAENRARVESEKRHLQETIQTAANDIETLQEVIKWEEERLQNLQISAKDNQEANTQELHETLKEARNAYQEAVRSYDVMQAKLSTQKARLHAIADERINLNNRLIRAREREKSLGERLESLAEKQTQLKNQPKDSKNERQSLLTKISALEEERNQAAERLSVRENEITQNMKALREAENTMNDEREKRAHAQATFASVEEQKAALMQSIQEKFEVQAHQLAENITLNLENVDFEKMKSQKDQAVREREDMGPVNLRADDEAQELEKEVTKLLNERNDLMEAIAELRGGISKINKEARERLLGAFEHVNAHFKTLFTQLFGGGKAHLELVDSPENMNDPLGAGLEIFAQPPGKALQSLSLLSGGEQTLASIALIFAMFLTNPSPICVLDEIDAPLDDANVERVCDLLDEIAARGMTRFLIITHHRLTMARMDRLYGVTMSEKGVSQLVSVDLQQSFQFLEAA